MTILATIVVLGVLIFVHELGHFLAAKAVDIRVERFSIGLGPVLAAFRWGETEYALSWIPLGGYVKMGGMDDEVMEAVEGGGSGQPREPGPRDFDAKPIWARVLVISAGVILNFAFAFAVYAAIAGIVGSPAIDTRRIGEVDAQLLPAGTEALTQLPEGSELVAIGDREVGEWSDISLALRESAGGPTEFRTAGPTASVRVDLPAALSERLAVAAAIPVWMPAQVGAVNLGTPAARAGLEAGDRIVAVEGTPVESWWDFVHVVQARPGQATEVEIERDGGTLIRTVTPDEAEETDALTGEVRTYGVIGVLSPAQAIPVRYERVGLVAAVGYGWDQTVGVTALILGFLKDLVTGQAPASSVGSIGAIAEMSGAAAREGLITFLEFMALFSVNLAVLNLLPIPILDGGHLMFLLVEAVRGRALSVQQRMRLSQVGLVIVMGLMLFALSNDLRRFFGF